ncbi:histidyl-tRNA synthetase [Rubellimicrobium thermophilum DSM 16684]|uniref:Histidine--tRNA ligase n=1 Tax=Rubellimicrobium thermophilum DSM 16684 TaxID=1123069 RepID=S9R324_9RHOB|nr:histidyl-tRNA synthetase [Rubellimicrobium thermophilum DSM 16684]
MPAGTRSVGALRRPLPVGGRVHGRVAGGFGLALGLPLHQHRHASFQHGNLARLPRHHVGKLVHGADQMRHPLFEGHEVCHARQHGAFCTGRKPLPLPRPVPGAKAAPHQARRAALPRDPKPRRPRAETPKGFRDYFGAEVTERASMLDRIAAVYRRHGFEALETSAVETVEALGKFLPDVDRPNEGVFAWQEEEGDWLALRYDLTAPLARVYAQHRPVLPTPYRRYAMGPVWRNEKPGPGRFRQFYQCDADTVGAPGVAADAEIIAMLCEALQEVGIPRGDFLVKVNNRKVLNGVLEVAGLLDPADPDRHAAGRGIALRAIDKLDRLGEGGVRALLGEGRRDESGDFTRGANLAADQADVILAFVRARGADGAATLRNLEALCGRSRMGAEGIAELAQIAELLDALGLADRVILDPATVRGLGYYTGPVYEAELTFEILGEDGQPRRFGSVAGGGRYDDLVKRFTGETVPATGVSIGVDRLLAALRATGRSTAEAEGPIVVTVMDRDRMADAFAMAAELRAAGLRAEVYLGNPRNFGAQMKYADRRRAPFAVIEGSDERARGVVQVKDLALGAALAAGASLEQWKDRPAQQEVPRAELAARLAAMLRKGPGS